MNWIEKEKLFADFLNIKVSEFSWKDKTHLIYGDGDNSFKDITFFQLNWDLVIFAAEKFSNLDIQKDKVYYQHFCDNNKASITSFNLQQAVKTISESIEWYNSFT